MSEPAEGKTWQQLIAECLARSGSFRPEQLGFTNTDPNIWRKPNLGPDGPPLFWLSMELGLKGTTTWQLHYLLGECPTCGHGGQRQVIYHGTLPDLATTKTIFSNLALPKKHATILCRTIDAA